MASNDINTVNLRPKRASACKNANLDDFTVYGLAKKPTQKTIKGMKELRKRLEGPNRETCPIKRRNLATTNFPIEETIMVPGGQYGHPDQYFLSLPPTPTKFPPPPVDSTTDDSDDSASTQSDPMEGIEPAEGTFSDEKRKFKCDRCDLYYEEEDIHEERNVTDELHLLCKSCFYYYEKEEEKKKEEEKQREYEEIVWPEDAQLFSRNPAHFEMTQPQYPEKSITSGIIDLTIAEPAPASGAFWRFESDSNLVVID